MNTHHEHIARRIASYHILGQCSRVKMERMVRLVSLKIREVRKKENVIEVNGEFLHYGLYMEYHYDEEKSCDGCSKDDEIYVLNAPLAAVASLWSRISYNDTLG